MTLAKRLLLGSAAAIVTVSGAQAADPVLPAPAVDYVQICSIGSFTGFLLPGSDVCFDMSGFARWQVSFNGEDGSNSAVPGFFSRQGSDGAGGPGDLTAGDIGISTAGNLVQFTGTVTTDPNGATTAGTTLDSSDDVSNALSNDSIASTLVASTGSADDYDMVGVFELNLDARTMTEWGLLRGFIRIDGEMEDDAYKVDFEQGYVQIGGLTAGVADSFFDPVFTDYVLATHGDIAGTDDLALIGYSMNFGNGFTGSLSLENDEARQSGILYWTDVNGGVAINDTITGPVDTSGTAGIGGLLILDATDNYDDSATMPDVVAALRLDQAWGTAKLSAALHEVDPAGTSVDSEFGYAFGASAEFNLPVGYGSTFGIFGNYGYGAVSYVGFDGTVGEATLPFVDAVYDMTGDDLDLTTAYGFGAGLDIGLGGGYSWQLDGFYTYVDHGDVWMTTFSDLNADNNVDAGELTTDELDLDGSVWAIRTSVKYVPFAGLTLQAGVAYQSSDFDVASDVDDDQIGARFRITRSF